jgi:hypothetical protein
VLERLEARWPRHFIELHNVRGNQANIGRLASTIAPLALDKNYGNYVDLVRPATRFLVVFDREGPFATDAKAEEVRQKWIEEFFTSMPEAYQTPTMREALNHQIELHLWEHGAFEFAHFTDDELYTAIQSACARLGSGRCTTGRWQIEDARNQNRSIERVFPGRSKLTKLE